MALQPVQDEAPAGAPAWMTTFADLMSLLLTFFVLLLSFSSLEIVKFRTMAGMVRSAFGMRSPVDIMDSPSGSRLVEKPVPVVGRQQQKTDENMTLVRLREALEASSMQAAGTIEVEDRGVVLRLQGDALFDSGKAELKAGALPLLDRLVATAAASAGTIEIEGHSDDVPIRTAQYPSNWELSASRAGSAARYLTRQGVPPARIKAIGYADTRPLAPNDSAEARARNRRVEFVFVRPESSAKSPGRR